MPAADGVRPQSAGYGGAVRPAVRCAGDNGCADAGADGGANSAGEETVYVLCEGRSDGAKALSRWLRSAGKDTAETFIPDGLDTPMYTIPAAERDSEEIPAATDETRRVRVAADTELLESGILTAWLPAFETATGYIAEVYAGDASVLAAAAAAGEADVLLMKRTDASALGTMTHYPLRYELVSTIYSVI